MNTVAEVLIDASRSLHSHSDSPRLDAELLLGKILGLPRAALIVQGNSSVADERKRAYDDLVARRLRGVPIAYLTGVREFWSLSLKVTPAVLVPRPETELLVELALTKLPTDQVNSILDLGTGSGSVALAIASERPPSRLVAVDLSAQALEVAIENSVALGIDNIDWRVGSWFDAVPTERFDVIVANPPYVATADPALLKLTAEPVLALVSGVDGLDALSLIAANAALHIKKRGWLILEHGSDQADAVAGLMRRHGFADVRSHLDLSGKPRVTLGTVHTNH